MKTFFALLCALFCLMAPSRSHAQIVIIANPEMTVSSISREDVREVFTGATSDFQSGLRVKPVLLKGNPAHDEFLAAYIGQKAAEFRSGWMGLLFAGKSSLPPSFSTEADVVAYVARHPSAIGYIHKATPHLGVILLTVR